MILCSVCGAETNNKTYLKDGNHVYCEECFINTLDWGAFNDELDKIYHNTIELLLTALDARDPQTKAHSMRVAKYALIMAERMGLSKKECAAIYRGALLHDIGKIGVPDNILKKPGSLSPEERNHIQKHPEIGYNILKNTDYLVDAADLVLSHHEKYDGTGYPKGLKGQEIPVGARIFSIADTIDAMMFDRYYRRAISFAEVKAEIKKFSGTMFDPDIVRLCDGCSGEIEHFVYMEKNQLVNKPVSPEYVDLDAIVAEHI